jgi:hypothetical protein
MHPSAHAATRVLLSDWAMPDALGSASTWFTSGGCCGGAPVSSARSRPSTPRLPWSRGDPERGECPPPSEHGAQRSPPEPLSQPSAAPAHHRGGRFTAAWSRWTDGAVRHCRSPRTMRPMAAAPAPPTTGRCTRALSVAEGERAWVEQREHPVPAGVCSSVGSAQVQDHELTEKNPGALVERHGATAPRECESAAGAIAQSTARRSGRAGPASDVCSRRPARRCAGHARSAGCT